MRWIDLLRRRLRALTRSSAVDADLRDEMNAHFEAIVTQRVASGLSPADARTAALHEFGGIPQLIDDSRDARGVEWIRNGVRDAAYGARLLARAPAFAAASILTIGLGIGAATAMFSVVYGIAIKPLPFRDPDRLVNIWTTAMSRGLPRAYVGMANVNDWRARNTAFEDIATLRAVASFNLTGVGEPERLNGSRISANLFSVLGVSPMLGRSFRADENEIGHDHVAILTYSLWQRRFAADRSVIGRVISLNGEPHTIVGVMGPEFAYPSRDYLIYTPVTVDPNDLTTRLNYSFLAVARLKRHVTPEQAGAELKKISADLEREYPKENAGIGAIVRPALEDTIAGVRAPLYLLLAAVIALLLIGCTNLINLLLARALTRRRELAVRAALGAGRARLVFQSVAELAPMMFAGGLLGIVGAQWVVHALVPMLPSDIPRVESVALNVPVLLFAVGTLVAIAAVVGVWPALDASRRELAASISDLSRGSTGGKERTRLRQSLVVTQIAVTFWLVIGAALLMRSFVALKQVNPGFNADRVYTLHLAIPRAKYTRDVDVAAFCARILERVQALPDVESVGMVNRLPLAGGTQIGPIEFEGVDRSRGAIPSVDYRTATPGYFRTLQIPILNGRTFADTDTATAPPVVIIDEQLARKVLPGVDPIGRRIRVDIPNEPWMTIVGVAGHVRHDRLDEDVRPQVYWNFRQRAQDRMALAVRTRGEPDAVASSIAGVIRSVDPDQPIYDARTLEAVVDRSLGSRRLQTMMLGAFAGIALLLAAIGVYGVIAYTVGQRAREFGIRLALGASRLEILAIVMVRSAALFGVGAVIGLVLATASRRFLERLLYGIPAFDLASIGLAGAVLFLIAVLACCVPAWRATHVDPTISLRAE